MRSLAPDPKIFDELLYKNLTLLVDNPEVSYPTAKAVWSRFSSLFTATFGLLLYTPMYSAYYYEALKEFYQDSVQYMELRTLFSPLYDLDGTQHDKEFVLQTYINTTKKFMQDYPEFIGTKIIYTSSRSASKSQIAADVKEAVQLRQKYPDYIAGYDLVSNEEDGNSLLFYINELLAASNLYENQLPFIFHAGETDWMDVDVDLNVLDAVLLNTTRIGHGYAISKHPAVTKLAREKNIAIEVCPISNQVLKLVTDLRNHPAAELIARDFPIVVASDDPVLWGATGLSYDFYEMFMGIGGAWADLATLKQLALNSLVYSSMSDAEKKSAIAMWQKQWDKFIKETMQALGLV